VPILLLLAFARPLSHRLSTACGPTWASIDSSGIRRWYARACSRARSVCSDSLLINQQNESWTMKLRNLFCFIATVTIFAAVTLIGRMQWVLCMNRHGPAMGLAELEVLNAERETPIEIRQTRYLKTSSSRATARSSSELVLCSVLAHPAWWHRGDAHNRQRTDETHNSAPTNSRRAVLVVANISIPYHPIALVRPIIFIATEPSRIR
jgi:hypothetical protein